MANSFKTLEALKTGNISYLLTFFLAAQLGEFASPAQSKPIDSKPATVNVSPSTKPRESRPTSSQSLQIGHYAPWGIDEYELFGLTRMELSSKFKDKLFFKNDFTRAELCREGTGLGYQGPVFNLAYEKDRVSEVQGIFEGCRATYARPKFKSKRAALAYVIEELSKLPGPAEQEKLKRARSALEELNRRG